MRRRDGTIEFEEIYFDHVFYSHKVNMRKPDGNIYEHVLQHINCTSNEAIFIDDSQVNIDGATAAGWQAVRHDPTLEIMSQLDPYMALFEV